MKKNSRGGRTVFKLRSSLSKYIYMQRAASSSPSAKNGRYYSGPLFRIYFYRESSGNNYLSAISDHNMPERKNYYFHFFLVAVLSVSFLYLEVFRLCLCLKYLMCSLLPTLIQTKVVKLLMLIFSIYIFSI